ncbi:methyltransferase-like protein 17, mitochondrial [Lucilia cuprina]|uniref:methyltransferase-like protein 17, mitochondrial n=1 Tax=Lucilia cuprina TaxID=7375 RepID=UPI001F06CDF8|nr:methyltransferase-like protein 17, mitochondrial [Lucilia cuprina]
MNLSMKNITKPLQLIVFKQLSRNTSKIAVEVDEHVLRKIENDEVKARQHPGVMKFNRTLLPGNIEKALQKAVGDFPIKTLMEDCKKLNQFIASRHPPAEAEEMNVKVKKIMEEIETIMPQEQMGNLSEQERKQWQQRREQLLQRRLRERSFAWKPVQYGEYEALVYAVARGAHEYGVLMRILQEIKTRDSSFKPQSYFDFGSGVGTGMWASSNLWKDSIFEYFNVDSSRHMNELSELILRDGNENQQMTLKNVFYRQFLPGLETKYDLVICSHSLFELASSENRLSVILNLWKKCDGYMVIVEEGTRRGSQLVNEARDFVLSLEKHSLVGHVFAPCPHDNICPRLSNPEDRTPCNFEITFMPTNLNKKSKRTATARFSYVILKKGLPEDSTRAWPRIVRPTLLRSKHAICRMCTSEGKLQEIIFTESKHGRPAYRCAKAGRWGDRLPITIGEPFETMTKTKAKTVNHTNSENVPQQPMKEE